MAKQTAIPLAKQKKLIRLYEGDEELLFRYHPSLSLNEIIRILVRAHLSNLQEKENRTDDRSSIDLNDVLDGHDIGVDETRSD